MTGLQLIKFIEESNKIENVHSLQAIYDSIDAWIYLKKVRHLTLRDILNTHYLIMKNLNSRIAGKTRTELMSDVRIGYKICPSFRQVNNILIDYIYQINTFNYAIEELIKQSHIQFENIHPFEDGNGRIGRLLWLWARKKAGLPFKLIEFNKRSEYYEWFQ